ncbi:MAG: hypothetical protein ACTFAK_00780 [Candidatus Electronema sp. VV]
MFKSEAERVAFLFDLHQKYTASLLPLAAKEKKPGRRKKTAAVQGGGSRTTPAVCGCLPRRFVVHSDELNPALFPRPSS